MKAFEITTAATSLVGGDRARTHGDKTANHQVIADLWNGLLKNIKGPLCAHDVANMMELLKIARRYTGAFNVDDYIDGSGYAAVAGEIRAEQLRRDQSWADAAVLDAAAEGMPSGPIPAPPSKEATAEDIRDALYEFLRKAGANVSLAEAS